MPDPVAMTILTGVTLLAFTIASVAGFGGGLILMPVLVWMLGPREAIPIITLVQVVGAVSRVGLNWKEIRPEAVFERPLSFRMPPWEIGSNL